MQSFALFDILQSDIPFLATNISAHRAQIPVKLHTSLPFLTSPVEGLPEVTIVITVCDRTTKYINSAIGSILNQIYPQHLIHVYFAASCLDMCPVLASENVPSLSLLANSPECWDADSPRTSLGRSRNEATARTKTELVVSSRNTYFENYVRDARLNPDRAIFTSYADLLCKTRMGILMHRRTDLQGGQCLEQSLKPVFWSTS